MAKEQQMVLLILCWDNLKKLPEKEWVVVDQDQDHIHMDLEMPKLDQAIKKMLLF